MDDPARPHFYRLDADRVVQACSSKEWAGLYDKDRHVADTTVHGVRVSTVFLGLDHRLPGEDGPPLVFETMVFGGPHDGVQWRCSTWACAEAMHREAVALVKSAT